MSLLKIDEKFYLFNWFNITKLFYDWSFSKWIKLSKFTLTSDNIIDIILNSFFLNKKKLNIKLILKWNQ